MARNREMKHESLVHQVESKLKSKLAIGQSKQADKKAEHGLLKEKRKENPKAMLSYQKRITIHKIYSWEPFVIIRSTLATSSNDARNVNQCKTLGECRAYVDELLTERSGLSAFTVKLGASALAKLYDCTTNDFAKTAVRHREDIKRSRKAAKRDVNFSETKNQEFIEFCKATGLRNEELKCLRGTQLICKNEIY